MRTLRQYFIIAVALLLPVIAFAQNDDTEKKKHTVKGISISLGYSYGGITSNPSYVDQIIVSKITGQSTMTSEYCNEIANASFNIALEFSEKIELDFMFSYNHNHGKLNPDPKVESYKLPYTEDWFTLMPGVKYNWLRKNIGSKNGLIKLYSKANIGVSLANRYEIVQGGAAINSAGAFAYQVVPFGFEIGGRTCRFFLEGGYGYTGYVRGGVKFSFGHSYSEENNGINGDSWYKDYLKMK